MYDLQCTYCTLQNADISKYNSILVNSISVNSGVDPARKKWGVVGRAKRDQVFPTEQRKGSRGSAPAGVKGAETTDFF